MYTCSPVCVQNSSYELSNEIIFGNVTAQLDEVDITLLTALQEDADRTNVELARLAGLSPAATLHRVRRLKESGVIRIVRAQLDPAAAGFPLQVYVTPTLSRHDPRAQRIFNDHLRALPQIIAAHPLPPSIASVLPPSPHLPPQPLQPLPHP